MPNSNALEIKHANLETSSVSTNSNVRDSKARMKISRVMPDSTVIEELDNLAIEEPLEIRIGHYENGKLKHRAISITMRTPGSDFELATGFLFTEGIIQRRNQIENIKYCGDAKKPSNTVRVDLAPDTTLDFKKLERHFYTSSSCGVCGKSSLNALATGAQTIDSKDAFSVSESIIRMLPERLRNAQNVFDETGGLHAAGIFDQTGKLLELREDVGRHNALDKIIGTEFLKGSIPLSKRILFLSGRSSFELVQKAVMAQIPIIAAVSAPSSLAVDAAIEFGVTLLGFVRDDKFNIYSNGDRIINEASD